MKKIKTIGTKMIWWICGKVNWRVCNLIVDILGYDNYSKIMELQMEK